MKKNEVYRKADRLKTLIRLLDRTRQLSKRIGQA